MIKEKLKVIEDHLRGKRILLALSGGVDSSTLLVLASRVASRIIAVTFKMPTVPQEEVEKAKDLASRLNVEWELIELDQFQIEGFSNNPKNRCYLCKSALATKLLELARRNDLDIIIEGTNQDDLKEYRPGLQALREAGIVSPYVLAKINKDEIRELARSLNLNCWDLPSSTCFASRIPYDEEITLKKLEVIQKAEQFLKEKYSVKQVRVRLHDFMARIEVPLDEMEKVSSIEKFQEIVKHMKRLGYKIVTLDMAGFRSGSMDALN
ncbi:MAG: ATP-dependent sacrificial sulfur transferase LarE [Candidatus Helarchaeota archaeon]